MHDPPAVLALFAHPDDAEILAGGTLALAADLGCTIDIVTFTSGDCGSEKLAPAEISAIRCREAAAAAAVLGGRHESLGVRDLEVVYTPSLVARVTEQIRRTRADIVLAHSPQDYMLDHEEASRIARAACFNAPIPNAPSTGRAAPLASIPALYYADPIEGVDALGGEISPSFVIDIESVFARKTSALAEHASQEEWLRRQHGVSHYLESMRAWSEARGALAGCAFGEGFRPHRGHAYPRDERLETLLAPHLRRVGANLASRATGEPGATEPRSPR